MADFDHKSSRYVDQPQGAFLLAKSHVLNDVGLFDERFPMFFSDVDWCYRVKQHGWLIRFCSGTSVLHKKGASIYQRRAEMIVTSHRSFVDYFRKYDKNKWNQFTTFLIYILLLVISLPRFVGAVFKDNP